MIAFRDALLNLATILVALWVIAVLAYAGGMALGAILRGLRKGGRQ